MAAPPGRYTLRFSGHGQGIYYAAAGPTDEAGSADTLELAAGQSIGPIELRLGSCEIRVRLPPVLEGARIYIDLAHPGSVLRPSVGEDASCTGGWLVMRYPGLAPGTYLACTSQFARDRWTLPVGSSMATAERIEVTAGGRAHAEFELPAPAVLRGSIDGSYQRLRDLDGGRGVRLSAYRPDSTRLESAEWSDSRTWSLTTFEVSPLRLLLEIGGMARWIGGPGFQEAAVFTPAWGETTTVPQEVESGILLRVAGPDSLPAAPDAVELYDSLGVRLEIVGGGGSHGPNLLAFVNLVPGSYYLRLRFWNYQRQNDWSACWYPGSGDQAHATPIRIRERGELVTLEFRPPPAARIRGHLQTAYPREYESLLPTLWEEGNTSRYLYHEWLADSTEPFEFSGMELGRYLISVTIVRGGVVADWWYPGSWHSAEAQPIDLHDFGQVEELNWSLPL